MKYLSLFFVFIVIACQDSTSTTTNKNQPTQQVIQETSPRARFEQFIAQFPTVKLPYAVSELDNFERLDDISIERVLGVKKDVEWGLEKSINCIATFKVHNLIAVLYQSTKRPNNEHNPSYFKLALYSPYGALKGEAVLGKVQSTERFSEKSRLIISSNFKILVEHHIDIYVPTTQEMDTYHSFYTQEYQIYKSGQIKPTKEVALWEKIPEEFVAPFIFEQKKTPNPSTSSIEKMASKTILRCNKKGYNQVIVEPFSDSLIFVSSLEMETLPTSLDSFYVNSKIAIIQLQDNRLKILSTSLIPTATWPKIYAAIQDNCDCLPAPAANSKGIVNLTMLETPLQNGVFAQLNQQNIEFICNQAGKNTDTSFYSIPLLTQ